MRTIYPVLFVIALGVAGAMLGMSGYQSAVGLAPASGLDSPQELRNQSDQSGIKEGVEGDASNAGDGDIIGLIIDSGQAISRIAGMVILLPLELQDLGFPAFFAIPLGLSVQTIVGVGVFQFISGRQWR